MKRILKHIAVVVKDYEEAIAFYTQKLGFVLIEDTPLDEEPGKRWVMVAPSEFSECLILLARAKNEHQISSVGNQSGGRVFLFMYTDDFWRDFHQYKENGVRFVREPKEMPYGTVAVFEDLYGNLWDLIEPAGGLS